MNETIPWATMSCKQRKDDLTKKKNNSTNNVMFKWLIVYLNTYQTRILLGVVCIALMTNIATIVVLFEQLEHESLCDQQNEFNDFIEDHHHAQSIEQMQTKKSDIIKIPKPKKISDEIPTKQLKTKVTDKKSMNQSNTIYEYRPSEVQVSDWKYNLDIAEPQILSASKECNYKNYASTRFINALSKWIFMREYSYFAQHTCPKYLQSEYRPKDLVPHIYQSQCAPFWPSDIVYLVSEILSPSMIGIQYGFTLSSVWLSNYVSKMSVVDNKKEKVNEFNEYLNQHYFDFSNFELNYQRMSKKYVQIIDPKKGSIVDFVVMESVPEYHEDVLKYVVSAMRKDNAVLVIKMSDDNIPKNMNELIDLLIPKHWLRYDSFIPSFLAKNVPFSQEKYLEQHNMTIWISRTEINPCDSL